VANLKTIDAAKATWALENKKTNDDVPADTDLFSGRYMSAKPICPAGGAYTLGAVSAKPTCTVLGHQLE
jgi:hypothetical protein